jgi:hypothetical protein
MSQTEMLAKMAELEAENKKLKEAKAAGGALSLKVSAKGAVSLYGMGRFPVTLFAEQWGKILDPTMSAKITQFIADNQAALSYKENQAATA